LYCSPYLALALKNYEALDFYDLLVELVEASTSLELTIRRALLPDHPVIKLARLAQTIAVRRDLREMRAIRRELRADAKLRAFHSGKSRDLPGSNFNHLKKRLGRFAELLSAADLTPVHTA